MQKAYNRINWENYPSEATALNETNLNRMDYGLNEVDNRVISLDTTKLDVNSANGLVQAVTINNETGTITVTKMDGTTVSLETNLSKITTNWSYNRETQQIVLTQSDGTPAYIDLSYLIQQNEFTDTTTIAFSVVSGVVSANIKAHSITDEHLQTRHYPNLGQSAELRQGQERTQTTPSILPSSHRHTETLARTSEISRKIYSILQPHDSQALQCRSILQMAVCTMTLQQA